MSDLRDHNESVIRATLAGMAYDAADSTNAVPEVPLHFQTERQLLTAMRTAAAIRDADSVSKYADALRALRGN